LNSDALITSPRTSSNVTDISEPGYHQVSSEESLRFVRADRIRLAQDEEVWIRSLKDYLQGNFEVLSGDDVERCERLSASYELVDHLLYYAGNQKRRGEDRREEVLRLVVPTTAQSEVLHHYHASLAGGHQGVTRTYERVRRYAFWRGQYQDVRDYVAACPDCQSGKGAPRFTGSTPGNLVATRPFQVIGMDHVPSLPKSHRGNSELLIWVDHHTGFVIVSANKSREAQEVAESYERCVYRRFGASEVIRHDREPAFMSEVFRSFNRLIGQRSRATLAYRPQSNGMTERMVQTVMHAVRLYVSDPAQRDWDDYAERLVFALNSSWDRTREETPFYLLHGWDPRSTLEVSLPMANRLDGHPRSRSWRSLVQKQYQQTREQVNRLLQQEMEARRDRANESERGDTSAIVPGVSVWVFINQVKPGYAKKLAHLWHGPFRVLERVADHVVRLELDNTDYKFFPLVHVSRLKEWKVFRTRPAGDLNVAEGDRFDFDEALLPEDSFDPDPEAGEFEVAEVLDHRDSRVARQGRRTREFLVRWVGYGSDSNSWIPEEDVRAPSLIDDYERKRRAEARFAAMEVEQE
jgi:hypothetical protein